MDTTLHPEHILLDIKPESVAVSRVKVIITSIAIALCLLMLVTDDYEWIKRRTKQLKTELVKRRPRRNHE